MRAAGRWAACAALAAVLVLALAGPAATAGTAPAQSDPSGSGSSTSAPGTTTENVLEGQPTTPASTTTASTTAPANAGKAQTAANADSRKVWLIVAALVLVAVLLGVLTFLYWRHTRPPAHGPRRARRPGGRRPSDDRDDDLVAADGPGRGPGGRTVSDLPRPRRALPPPAHRRPPVSRSGLDRPGRDGGAPARARGPVPRDARSRGPEDHR